MGAYRGPGSSVRGTKTLSPQQARNKEQTELVQQAGGPRREGAGDAQETARAGDQGGGRPRGRSLQR